MNSSTPFVPTRREALRTLGAGVAVGFAASRPRGAGAQQPKRGGSIKVSHPGTPRNLDPAKQVSGDEYMITNQVFETLVHYNYDGKLQPLLAESWQKSPDLKTWTFNLRKGVKFHHGKELTAEDVKVTIEHVLDPKTGCPLRSSLEMIEAIETPAPDAVRFRLKIPYGELDAALSSREASIVAKDKLDVLSKEVSGTGPFKFKEIMQGDRVVMVRNPDYWRSGLPYLDEIVLKEIPEAATRVTSLQNGETDILWQVPFDLVDQLKGAKGIRLSEVATSSWDAMVMDVRKKPFDNPKVRKAVRLAVNKDELIKVAIRGHGQRVVIPLLPSDPVYPGQTAAGGSRISQWLRDANVHRRRSSRPRETGRNRVRHAQAAECALQDPAGAHRQVLCRDRRQRGVLLGWLVPRSWRRYAPLSKLPHRRIVERLPLEQR
jgi:peptide/nickel transport system substrate-binding protein